MVDERDSAVVYMVALFLRLLGCCVLFVHFIIPTIPKKRSDSPAVFLVSLVSLVWSTYVIYSPKQKTQSVVCGCLVLMPLWTDAIGVFFFFFPFFYISAMCGWSICYVLRVHFLGVAPRCRFFRVVRIDEVPCTDPLPLYVEFLTLRSYR